ncbi:MAG: GNAT family N-acetyltransferase [Clostridia bacterium]|nr:GNAT family N-acetyltransferase [Clostridia bacterium]
MSSNVNIRKCDHTDLDILIKMRLEFLKEAGHVKDGEDVSVLHSKLHGYITMHLNNDLHFWLAEIENETVAAGAVSIWDKLPVNAGKGSSFKIAYFSNMYTKPGYRKKGIASDIMKRIIQFLKEEGIQKAMLHALEDGKGIYKNFGFSSKENLMEMDIYG